MHDIKLQEEKDYFESFDDYDVFVQEVYKDVARETSVAKDSTGIELCCGQAPFARALECKADGLDIAPKLLNKAKHLRHRFVGDAHYPQRYVKEKYDWVCFFSSLHNLRQPKIAIYNCDSILKKGGKLILFEPNILHPQRFLFLNNKALGQTRLNPYRMDMPYRQALNPSEMIDLLDFLGYRVEKLMFITPQYRKESVSARMQKYVAKLRSKYLQTYWLLVSRRAN